MTVYVDNFHMLPGQREQLSNVIAHTLTELRDAANSIGLPVSRIRNDLYFRVNKRQRAALVARHTTIITHRTFICMRGNMIAGDAMGSQHTCFDIRDDRLARARLAGRKHVASEVLA